MGIISQFYTFVDGTTSASLITAERLNNNWSALYGLVNGYIDQDNIESGLSLVISAATLPAWSAGYEGKILYAQDTLKIWIANDSQWIEFNIGSHAVNHRSGGSDEILLDTLGTPTDVTTLNASTSRHGLLPKLSNVSTEYLNGVGGWANPKIDDLTVGDDNTDGDATAARHGLLPKLSNNGAQYLDGLGGWTSPTVTVFRVSANSTSPYNTISNTTSRQTTSLTEVKIKEIRINETVYGTINLRYDFQGRDSGETITTRVKVNGVQIGADHETTNGDIDEPVTIDQTITGPHTGEFQANDLIQIYGFCDTSNILYVSNMYLEYDWSVMSIDGNTLVTPLAVTTVSALDYTNQDPT